VSGRKLPGPVELPADLAAQLEAADPRTCTDLRDLADHADVPVAVLILDALGEFGLLSAYQAGVLEGRRRQERLRRDAEAQADDEPPF
jgi:hypothetical protein